jgi:small GTP-binding protein
MAEELLIKTIIVGDGAIGKTCLMNAVKRPAEEMQDDYEATVADNEVVDWQFENETWQVDLWDTAGQENFSKLRLSAYPGSNVIMVAFDMTAPESLNNIVDADKGWVAEIKSKVKNFDTYVLVGTKHDLWKEKGGVTEDDYWAVAEKIGAKAVVMTSAKDKHNCPELKAHVLRIGIDHKKKRDSPAAKRPVAAKKSEEEEIDTGCHNTAAVDEKKKEKTIKKDKKAQQEKDNEEKDGCSCIVS